MGWFYTPPPSEGGGGGGGGGGAATSSAPVIQKDYIAAVALNAQRLVVTNTDGKVRYADPATVMDAVRILGITLVAVAPDAAVTVLTYGEIEEPTWTWDLGKPIYLGAAGMLTQTAPTTGTLLIIGVALTPTRLFLNPKFPIAL